MWRRQGLLWRREVNVAYRRIQDIHLTNGLIQRWLGLATVSIQTAAGSATPEITIEGVLEAEALRDYLYTKMRGVRDAARRVAARTATADVAVDRRDDDESAGAPRLTSATRCVGSKTASASGSRPHEPTRGRGSGLDLPRRVGERGGALPRSRPSRRRSRRSGEAVRAIRPAPGFLRYLKFFFWLLFVPGDVLPLIGWIADLPPWQRRRSPCVLAVPFLFADRGRADVIAYVAIHLRYDTTWYVLTDRSLRIRRGIWIIHETTISFENVQNVEVRQGPLQRYFGIADVVVTTAGGGARQAKGEAGDVAQRAHRHPAGSRRRAGGAHHDSRPGPAIALRRGWATSTFRFRTPPCLHPRPRRALPFPPCRIEGNQGHRAPRVLNLGPNPGIPKPFLCRAVRTSVWHNRSATRMRFLIRPSFDGRRGGSRLWQAELCVGAGASGRPSRLA